MKFRKKPVVIDAWQWNPLSSAAADKKVPLWFLLQDYDVGPGNSLLIQTLEGTMRADPGDWIIRDIKNEVYPIKPDIFAATYVPADS